MSPSTDQRENREFAAEIKFRVPHAIAHKIQDWARTRLAADPHASDPGGDAYQITSLYFDTASFDVFHRKGSFGRSKYRIRRYGREDEVFLERKLKTRGLLTKRRSIVKVEGLAQLAANEPRGEWPGFWFHRRLLKRRLRPVCQVTYRRTARVLMTNFGPIRLTLDQHIHALAATGTRFDHVTPGVLLSEDRIVLELKYRFQMPPLFKALVENFSLTPEPVSKYRLAATTLGLAPLRTIAPPASELSETGICLIF